MELLERLKKHLSERLKQRRQQDAEHEAKSFIYPACRMDDGELVNEIMVYGIPMFRVSNEAGRWCVKQNDVGEVVNHLRQAVIEVRLKNEQR